MTDGTTSSATQCAEVAQQVEQRSRKATVRSSTLRFGSIFAILFALMLACVPANYARDLDQCAFENAGNRAATVQCQCEVAKQYGRDCNFLQADGAVSPADASPKE